MAQLTADAAARSPTVRRTLFWTLGFGAFGLAFSITTTAAYLPPLLRHFTDSGSLIGLILGAEGVFALALSPVIGPWSDTFHTPLGRRRPFMLAALGPMGFCLLLLPFMPNLWTTTLIGLAFFFAYYVYEPPYRGLYPDLLPPSTYGRAQGIQHVLRGIALGAALVGGGFLLKAWHAAPFVLAAFVTTAACGAAILFVSVDGGGFIVAGLATTWHNWYFGLIVPVSIAGGTVMTLAWGLLFKLMPPEHRGAISGLATTTKGLGLLLGAPVAGAAIDLARPFLHSTDGYQVLWPVCGIPILAAIPLVARMMRVEPSAKVEPPAGGWRAGTCCAISGSS